MVMPATYFLPRAELDRLFGALAADGRRVMGPTIADGAVVYDELQGPSSLPYGWTADTAPGSYRLRATDRSRAFDYGVAVTAWKRFTHPSLIPLTRMRRDGGRIAVEPVVEPAPRLAFVGVRACELAALDIQERAMRAGPAGDSDHAARRDAALIVAVECAAAASTCFCTSMGTGPEVNGGADLVLSELDDGFVIRVGSPAGAAVVERLDLRPSVPAEIERAGAQVAAVRAAIGDPVAADGLPERLRAALDHARWSEVAERCLACANCTLVCPTCFCVGVEDTADLTGETVERSRVWNSCFSLDHSYVAGGSVRQSGRSRYRQWMTHKLATWHDQFGTSGCVGCGRCIAWCPVGIDITEEAAAIREGAGDANA